MKRLLLLCYFFLGLFLNRLNGQGDFAPIGAMWHFSYSGPSESEVGYSTFESVEDTVIAGQACRVLLPTTFKKNNGAPNSVIDTAALPPVYSYSVPDTVFYYNEVFERFLPWYIFNVEEGDTVAFMVPDTQSLSAHPDSLFRIIIDSVTAFIIEDTAFDQIHFRPLDGYSFGGKFDAGYYNEIIGAGFGPYHQTIDNTADFHPPKLRCYEDDWVSYKSIDVEACDLIADVSKIGKAKKLERILVFPNPTPGILYVRSDLEAIKTVVVYDMFGKEIIYSNASPGNATRLDLSSLPKGLYILKIETEGNWKTTKVHIL